MDLYDIPLRTIDGAITTLDQYRGKALLIVNVASRCGFTPQYKGLEELYRKYKDRGLVVLGFPCNQFGNQEPEGEKEIRDFCDMRFGVTFPLFAKLDVNGSDAHPLYRHLTAAKPGFLGRESITWNFTKFLVDTTGAVVRRYGPRRTPEDIEIDVARVL